jgi:hypothetical protein
MHIDVSIRVSSATPSRFDIDPAGIPEPVSGLWQT